MRASKWLYAVIIAIIIVIIQLLASCEANESAPSVLPLLELSTNSLEGATGTTVQASIHVTSPEGVKELQIRQAINGADGALQKIPFQGEKTVEYVFEYTITQQAGASVNFTVVAIDLLDQESNSETFVITVTEVSQEEVTSRYDNLEGQLYSQTALFCGKQYQNIQSIGNYLYYNSYPTFSPKLHRYNLTTGTQSNYDFQLGFSDGFNYHAEETGNVIVTVEADPCNDPSDPCPDGQSYRVYKVFDANQPNLLLKKLRIVKPQTTQYMAYYYFESKLYLLDEDNEQLLSWDYLAPGQVEPVVVKKFSVIGLTLGIVGGMIIDYHPTEPLKLIMYLLEGFRLWRIDDILGSPSKHSANNVSQISTFNWNSNGVCYIDKIGTSDVRPVPTLFKLDDSKVEMKERIIANELPAELNNNTYGTIHHYTGGDWTVYDRYFIYMGINKSLFAYDYVNDRIKVLLLAPREKKNDVYITYKYPVVTREGRLFITQLESTSGATGAEGPIIEVQNWQN